MKRMVLDGGMVLLCLLVMCYGFLPKQLHEVLGVLLPLAAGLHLWWNRGWLSALWRGPRSWRRRLSDALNLLLLVVTVVVLVTGLCISHHLTRGLVPLAVNRSILLHQLHVSLSYAWLILAGLHLGLHWAGLRARLAGRLPLSLAPGAARGASFLFQAVLLAAGVWGSFLHRVGDRLLMKHVFATPAAQYPPAVYGGLLLAVLGLYAWLGFRADSWLDRGRG